MIRAALLFGALALGAPAAAQTVEFGDNSSDYARDGECDDARFEGPNVDSIISIDDIGRDASDCRAACAQGELLLRDY